MNLQVARMFGIIMFTFFHAILQTASMDRRGNALIQSNEAFKHRQYDSHLNRTALRNRRDVNNSRSKFGLLINKELRAFFGIGFVDFFRIFPGGPLFHSLSGSCSYLEGVLLWESYEKVCRPPDC